VYTKQVVAARAAGGALPLCLLDDLWRVPLPSEQPGDDGDVDSRAASAAGRPTPGELWGARSAALDVAARERLAQLLLLCRQACACACVLLGARMLTLSCAQVHDAERSVTTLGCRAEVAALARAEEALVRALRGRAASPPPALPHGAEAALRDWHAAALAAQAAAATRPLAPPAAGACAATRDADCACFDVRWSRDSNSGAGALARVAWSTRRRGVVARLTALAPRTAPLNGLRLECALEAAAAAAPFWLATRGDPAAFAQQVVWPAMDEREARVLAAAQAEEARRRAVAAAAAC
jgi:hypothetical protein